MSDKPTQSKIGYKWTPEGSYKDGHCYNIRGYRLFVKLLRHLDYLWKEHGIEVKITNLDMICSPYISFQSGSIENTAYIEVFIVSIRDELKDQDIVGSCSCKGCDEYWSRIYAEQRKNCVPAEG
jgi:hypothetical protein